MLGSLARLRRRKAPWALGLPLVVGVSTLLHWLAGRRLGGLWIMPDEAVYAARAVALWRHGTLPPLRGAGSGYGFLYATVAGIPFSFGSITRAYATLKLLQALVASLAAVPVFFFGRRLMPPAYALLAATLTVASPLLLYSGLVMTEVLFYPVAAVALLAMSRAVARATLRDQAIAVAAIFVAVLTRTQAVVFLPLFALAIFLDAWFARAWSRLRAFWPTWLVLAAGTAVVALSPSTVGSYAGVLRGSYPIGAALRLSYEHLSYVALASGLVPFAAVLLMGIAAARGRERDPAARALIAVCVATIALLVLQVGFFAARYAPHLLGRDLSPLPPLIFVVFSLWLARRSPPSLVAATIAAFSVLALVVVAPWNSLVVPDAFADTFDLILVSRAQHGHQAANVVLLFSIAVLAVFVLARRHATAVLPVIVLAVLITASAVGSDTLKQVVGSAQTVLGPDRSWIDERTNGNVAYLYDGEEFWNIVWQERFWNAHIDKVFTIGPRNVPGPMPQSPIDVRPSGLVPFREQYAVASDLHTFFGTAVAHLPQPGLDVSGLTLWKLDDPPRLSTVESGVKPNGDIYGSATVGVYDCHGGRLELTLLPKATKLLLVELNGRVVLQRSIGGLSVWHGSVTAPPSERGRKCTFTIAGQQLLGSTRIAFVRP
jgi:hypothetical protein